MEMEFQKVWNGWLRQLKENLDEEIFEIFILLITVLYNYNLKHILSVIYFGLLYVYHIIVNSMVIL